MAVFTTSSMALLWQASDLSRMPEAARTWHAAYGERSERLARELRKAVDDQRFGEVVDLWAGGAAPVPTPNLDVAVIELDSRGRPTVAADVLLDRAHPHGVAVPVDQNFATTDVRWRRWDADRWQADRTGRVDLVPGRERAGREFMAPYPASVFKLMVAFGVLRLVDRGVLALDEPYAYTSANGGCPGGDNRAGTRTNREWLDGMLTYSDNRSTCALIRQLHDRDAVDDLNATLAGLGLDTLHLGGTDPVSGGRWTDAITMTALDTARLLLAVSGAPGLLWLTPDGRELSADDVLSARARAVFLGMLADQGLNRVLSTANWCGLDYPAAGIPQRVAQRWVNPADGTVTVPGRSFGQDVRPCNARAEVTFAHKTGLTEEAGGDAGIVTSLPGAPERRYIVVVLSTLGTRYGDPGTDRTRAGRARGGTCTEKLGALGRRIDALMTGHRDG